MARIAGVNIPLNKRVEVGLTTIYGVGLSTSQKVLEKTNISADTYVKDLTDDEIGRLRDAIDNDLTVEGDLRRERSQDVKRLTEIGSYRGLRHRRGLPVRGQRTKTNARGRKGPRRGQVAQKKKVGKHKCLHRDEGPVDAGGYARTSRSARRTSRPRSTTRSSRSPTARAR